MKAPLSADCALLLRGLHEALELSGAQWDRVLRLARMTGLHGRLAAANADSPMLPERVRLQMEMQEPDGGLNAFDYIRKEGE